MVKIIETTGASAETTEELCREIEIEFKKLSEDKQKDIIVYMVYYLETMPPDFICKELDKMKVKCSFATTFRQKIDCVTPITICALVAGLHFGTSMSVAKIFERLLVLHSELPMEWLEYFLELKMKGE